MRIREQWGRRRLGRALTIATAALALLLLVLFLILALRDHTAPADPKSGAVRASAVNRATP